MVKRRWAACRAHDSRRTARRRAAGIEALELDLRDEDVRGAVEIDDVAPPAAARPINLGRIDQQRVDPLPANSDIVDRALRRPEFRPGPLPRIAELDGGVRPAVIRTGIRSIGTERRTSPPTPSSSAERARSNRMPRSAM